MAHEDEKTEERAGMRVLSVHDYVGDYEFRFGGGGAYQPTESERAMIEDAIEGYLAAHEEALEAAVARAFGEPA